MNRLKVSRLVARLGSPPHAASLLLVSVSSLGLSLDAHAQLPPIPVTGFASDGTAAGNQAETDCSMSTVGGTSVESVTYNDNTNQSSFVQYSQTTPFRTVKPGFSAMGWSNRTRPSGGTWGSWTHSIVPPPTSLGWDILWGDPSLATNSAMSNIVFMGTLAIPHDKLQYFSGLSHSNGNVVGVVSEDKPTDLTTPLGGGCIARSTDGGQSFSIVGCVRDTSPFGSTISTPNIAGSNVFGHFYDGSSLAVTQNGGGSFSAFAAFIDVETSREAIYKMSDITSNIANPFQPDDTVVGNTGAQPTDALGDIETHVRLLASGADLWKMSAQSNGFSAFSADQTTSAESAFLKLNVRNRNGGPIGLATDALIGEDVDLGPDANGTEITLRTATQFAYDVGVNEQNQPEVRFVYMAADLTDVAGFPAQNFHLQGGFCGLQNPANPTCTTVAKWSTPLSPNAMALFPAIKFAQPSGSSPPVWKVTFQGRNPSNPSQLAIFQADLVRPDQVPQSPSFTSSGLVALQVTPFQTPCPDVRAGTLQASSSPTPGAGYWGDYDYMTFDAVTGNFVRTFTDSSQGCDSRLPLNSHHVHVSEVDIPTTPPQVTVSLTGVQFGTTGFNICSACNCFHSLPDTTITCQQNFDPSGAISTTPATSQQELGCGDGHGALVTVTCSGTGSGPGLNVTVHLSIEHDCGSLSAQGNDPSSGQDLTVSGVLPGQSQTTSTFMNACDFFGGNCPGFANGGPCTFNDFNANVVVSGTGGF